MDPQEIKATMTTASKIVKAKQLLMTFELMGFSFSTVGLAWVCLAPSSWVTVVLGAVCGWLVPTFAYRFCGRVIDFFLTWVSAAQTGTLVALMGEKVLDKWDCGDPSCEGCKKAREARGNA